VAIVVIDGGAFCFGEEVARVLSERLGAARLLDQTLFGRAHNRFGVEPRRLERLMYGSRSLLDLGKRDQVRLVAHLRAAVAESMARDRQVYLGALRLSGFESIGRDNPLRFVELVAGYGAKGFRSDGDYSAGDQRERSLYFGVALNLTEILDRTVFAGKHGGGGTQWFATEALRYVQVPGTALLTKKTWRP